MIKPSWVIQDQKGCVFLDTLYVTEKNIFYFWLEGLEALLEKSDNDMIRSKKQFKQHNLGRISKSAKVI